MRRTVTGTREYPHSRISVPGATHLCPRCHPPSPAVPPTFASGATHLCPRCHPPASRCHPPASPVPSTFAPGATHLRQRCHPPCRSPKRRIGQLCFVLATVSQFGGSNTHCGLRLTCVANMHPDCDACPQSLPVLNPCFVTALAPSIGSPQILTESDSVPPTCPSGKTEMPVPVATPVPVAVWIHSLPLGTWGRLELGAIY